MRAGQQDDIDTSRADRERSLDVLHVLELHAGSVAPGREHDWLTGVRDAITTLEQALAVQEGNSTPDDGLLSAVAVMNRVFVAVCKSFVSGPSRSATTSPH